MYRITACLLSIAAAIAAIGIYSKRANAQNHNTEVRIQRTASLSRSEAGFGVNGGSVELYRVPPGSRLFIDDASVLGRAYSPGTVAVAAYLYIDVAVGSQRISHFIGSSAPIPVSDGSRDVAVGRTTAIYADPGPVYAGFAFNGANNGTFIATIAGRLVPMNCSSPNCAIQ